MLLRADRRRNPQQRSSLHIAGGKYQIDTDKKLGAGCFGEVWRGYDVSTREPVAVKFEDLRSQPLQLEHEASILRQLATTDQPQGFVRCFHLGQEGRFNCMVVDLLGRSLEDQLNMCREKKFTAPTAVLLAEQILCRIEYLHSKGIVHRDIKPDNFMSGVGAKVHHIYMIDFGLAKRYYTDGQHIKYRNQVSFTGTARYASINAHKGIQQTRRDDLEAIGHMLLYFLRGSLPWSGMSGKTEEKYRKICAKKATIPLDELCAGFPDEFKTYLRDVRKVEQLARRGRELDGRRVAARLPGAARLRRTAPAVQHPAVQPGAPGPRLRVARGQAAGHPDPAEATGQPGPARRRPGAGAARRGRRRRRRGGGAAGAAARAGGAAALRWQARGPSLRRARGRGSVPSNPIFLHRFLLTPC